jgi:hypothetical protein
MTNTEKIKKIKDRYFRKVIAHPKGSYVHFGHCKIYSRGICSCGLLCDLRDYNLIELYPNYYKDRYREIQAEEHLFYCTFKEYKKPAKKELKKSEKLLNKILKEQKETLGIDETNNGLNAKFSNQDCNCRHYHNPYCKYYSERS